MYNVVIPDRASKDLEKIDKKTQKIILLKIKEYSRILSDILLD